MGYLFWTDKDFGRRIIHDFTYFTEVKQIGCWKEFPRTSFSNFVWDHEQLPVLGCLQGAPCMCEPGWQNACSLRLGCQWAHWAWCFWWACFALLWSKYCNHGILTKLHLHSVQSDTRDWHQSLTPETAEKDVFLHIYATSKKVGSSIQDVHSQENQSLQDIGGVCIHQLNITVLCFIPLFFLESGVSRCKLLHIEWIKNKVLLYSTGNYIYYSVINHNGKYILNIYIYTYVKVAQLCLTLCDPMDCSLPGSCHRRNILHATILECVVISFSRGSSQPRDQTWASHIVGRFFTVWATREARVFL